MLSYLPYFEKHLLGHLTPAVDNELFAAARYSALGEGKRIRPRLCIEMGLALGASLTSLLDPACSLELIHTSSLIHDDLPCMDDDDFRRGKLSLHKAFNEAHALLTGDFLLVYPFQILANSDLAPEIKCSLIALLSKKIGAAGMIYGQHLDLSISEKATSLDLEVMYAHKTADLIEASLLSGAIVAGAEIGLLEKLQEIAQKLGLAYQLHNDLIDHSKLCGRETSSDEKNGKRTLSQLLGKVQVEEKLEKLISEVLLLAGAAKVQLPVVEEICALFSKAICGQFV